MHCKTRQVRVVRVEANDMYASGPATIGVRDEMRGTTSITLRDDEGTYITINTKNKNVGKFPNVGETVSADLYLRPIQAS